MNRINEIAIIDDYANDGVFAVPLDRPFDFNIRRACDYANSYNNGVISEEIVFMFKQ